jgi:hypothetical protein
MAIVVKRSFVRPMIAMILALQAFVFNTVLLAQEQTKKVDVNVDLDGAGGGPAWYGNWWIWAVAIAVFLIIIVALTNRGNRTETVVRER